jgi:YD repeat-containing protein
MPDLDGRAVEITKTYYDEADPKTNLRTETDPEAHTTTYEYNGRYLRTKRTNALQHDYVWAFDDDANLETERGLDSKIGL